MYQKNTQDGYIVSLVNGVTEGIITEKEYNEIKTVLANRPEAPEGYYYRLKTDLSWELNELPPITEEDEEISAEVALNELLGVLE